jgi:anaerobic glycerol-3-phosphate dehydrogenase
MRYDVVVIGGGTSALFAAMRLRGAGVSTVMVSGSKPSASMGCGELFPGDPGSGPDLPKEFSEKLLGVFPDCRLRTDTYLDINGVPVEAHGAPSSVPGISELPRSGLVLVSLPGIHDGPIEVNAFEALKAHTDGARVTQVRLQASIEDFYLSPMQWAARIDHPRFRPEILQRVAFQLVGTEGSAYLFPPLLGIEKHEEIMKELSQRLGAKAFEMLGIPGWPPGLRAGTLVEKAALRSGVELVPERAVSVERKAGGDIECISTSGGNAIQGRFFIVATGGLAGEGIVFRDTFAEPLFNLPVFVGDRKASEPSASASLPSDMFWKETLRGSVAVLSAGVKVDAEGRPLNEHGRPTSYNLRACGSIVAAVGLQAGGRIEPGWRALSGWNTAGRLLAAL